jgi:hypothetical protein
LKQQIQIGSTSVFYTEQGCYSVFADGLVYGAHPHWAMPHYSVIAHRCGYGDDLLAYCQEHEVCHHIVGQWITGGGSKVIRALAQGQAPDLAEAVPEEVLAQTFQRWLRANERPIVADVDWDGLKARALALLEG